MVMLTGWRSSGKMAKFDSGEQKGFVRGVSRKSKSG